MAVVSSSDSVTAEELRVSLKVTFELGDRDLSYFRRVMRESRRNSRNVDEKDVIQGTEELLARVRRREVPRFVRDRLQKLKTLTTMLQDEEWGLVGPDRNRVVSALAYFNEPRDLIPDDVPGFGFLDDAVMVELVVQELKHDLEAYDDFCNYRRTEAGRSRGNGRAAVTREQWLDARRRQLHARTRRRRARRTARVW